MSKPRELANRNDEGGHDGRGEGMNWNSAGEFFAMGGYGLYVWGSYGVTVLAIAIEILALRARLARASQLKQEQA